MAQDPQLVVNSDVTPASDRQQLYEYRRRVKQVQIDLNPLVEAFYDQSRSVEPSWLEKLAPRLFVSGIFMGLIGCGLALGAERMASRQFEQQEIAAVRMPEISVTTMAETTPGSMVDAMAEYPEVSDTDSALMDISAAPDQLGVIPLIDSSVELTVPGADSDPAASPAAESVSASESTDARSQISIRTVMVNGRSFTIPVPPLSAQVNESPATSLPPDEQSLMDLHMLKMPRQLAFSDATDAVTLYGKNPKEILHQIAMKKKR